MERHRYCTLELLQKKVKEIETLELDLRDVCRLLMDSPLRQKIMETKHREIARLLLELRELAAKEYQTMRQRSLTIMEERYGIQAGNVSEDV